MSGPSGDVVRVVLPHQLFESHLDADPGTRFVLVEHDLMFRQYRFHVQKLVLHRASMRRFADRLRDRGFEVDVLETDAEESSHDQLVEYLSRRAPASVHLYDVVDDWLTGDLLAAFQHAGCPLAADDIVESPNFLTTRAQIHEFFAGKRPRMQQFYTWQRRRLGILVDDDGKPAGGRWSFDTENRKKLPKNREVPQPTPPARHPEVDAAIAWVADEFPDNPGDADGFAWPTAHDEALVMLEQFLADRFAEFGPYEDAISTEHPFVFHSLLTPALNTGLLSPRTVLRRALEAGGRNRVPLASVEGFVRQLIGWREYMRASYETRGRALRSRNHLGHDRKLSDGWWTAETGLEPVDLVIRRILANGYAHHIERLMVLGNAMCLLRIDPEQIYEWFMEMFVDAYDWVMVPNVYAMSQFAAGEAITTKPYVSGSNYLKKMSDIPPGDWTADWDGLYWTFVRDHRDVFEANARSNFLARAYDRLPAATKAGHSRRAGRWLG
ncbi:cryptochrome/photolyase family protein [Gordonia sp. p3-SID1431]|uniref:cryptochrome/photolyase family protein n=1 Tax=Gordonia sp. p3-SID1431 TaxID=2916159 RepID=UPI0021A556FB|nr:cryptochrome/photolyase family protein [Gordonia sp. p3-SID1431]MCT1353917.1 cryptochrome/photolyase family protein [Gordonia sp. p3-SID1431]